MANHIKKNGIRTYPSLAICATFLCSPLCGLFAAMMTLRAENSFYHNEYVRAHKEAFMARICLLVSIIFGILTFVGIIAYVSYIG